ncbi:hypothetical protein [Haloarcula sp. CBA1127]|nr:hypothetical protein [Haloarcula sp. CBA1127]
MSDNICPVCDAVSTEIFRCSECGKLFDDDESSGRSGSMLGGGA